MKWAARLLEWGGRHRAALTRAVRYGGGSRRWHTLPSAQSWVVVSWSGEGGTERPLPARSSPRPRRWCTLPSAQSWVARTLEWGGWHRATLTCAVQCGAAPVGGIRRHRRSLRFGSRYAGVGRDGSRAAHPHGPARVVRATASRDGIGQGGRHWAACQCHYRRSTSSATPRARNGFLDSCTGEGAEGIAAGGYGCKRLCVGLGYSPCARCTS